MSAIPPSSLPETSFSPKGVMDLKHSSIKNSTTLTQKFLFKGKEYNLVVTVQGKLDHNAGQIEMKKAVEKTIILAKAFDLGSESTKITSFKLGPQGDLSLGKKDSNKPLTGDVAKQEADRLLQGRVNHYQQKLDKPRITEQPVDKLNNKMANLFAVRELIMGGAKRQPPQEDEDLSTQIIFEPVNTKVRPEYPKRQPPSPPANAEKETVNAVNRGTKRLPPQPPIPKQKEELGEAPKSPSAHVDKKKRGESPVRSARPAAESIQARPVTKERKPHNMKDFRARITNIENACRKPILNDKERKVIEITIKFLCADIMKHKVDTPEMNEKLGYLNHLVFSVEKTELGQYLVEQKKQLIDDNLYR